MHPKYAAVMHLQENSNHELTLLGFPYLKVCSMRKMQMTMYLGCFRSCSCSTVSRALHSNQTHLRKSSVGFKKMRSVLIIRTFTASFYGMKHILEVCKTSCFRKHVKRSWELDRMSLIISLSYYCPLYHCRNVAVESSVTDYYKRLDEMDDCSEIAE